MSSSSLPDDEPLRWVGEWKKLRYDWRVVERATYLPVQLQPMLTRRISNHAQSGDFNPQKRSTLAWALAHAQDVRPNALTLYTNWEGFLPGRPRLDVAINIQRLLEAKMYTESDFREWPVVCRLMNTGVPRAHSGRKQRCVPQVVFERQGKLWSCQTETLMMRELTCVI